jgi:hypothetical protein
VLINVEEDLKRICQEQNCCEFVGKAIQMLDIGHPPISELRTAFPADVERLVFNLAWQLVGDHAGPWFSAVESIQWGEIEEDSPFHEYGVLIENYALRKPE